MKYHFRTCHGFSKYKLRLKRKQYGMTGMVQIHHLVPKHLKHHNTLRRYKYNVEADYNFILLPTDKSVNRINLRENRVVHSGGHDQYNNFTSACLDSCESHMSFIHILMILYAICKGYIIGPWKSKGRERVKCHKKSSNSK